MRKYRQQARVVASDDEGVWFCFLGWDCRTAAFFKREMLPEWLHNAGAGSRCHVSIYLGADYVSELDPVDWEQGSADIV